MMKQFELISTFLLGMIAAFLIVAVINLKVLRHKRKKKVSLDTYTKFITTIVVAHGMVLTSCSYILAYIGMDPVVDVSSTIVREIVAPLVVYLGTNTIMNIFEKNKLSFSVPLNAELIKKETKTQNFNDNEAVG
ncbi:MAG: hypothetical protein K2N80_16090 [Lachnospiraceae bacterium]|nr:hypothetical protein [Lachnospiraceae bacterium]